LHPEDQALRGRASCGSIARDIICIRRPGARTRCANQVSSNLLGPVRHVATRLMPLRRGLHPQQLARDALIDE